MIKRIVGWFVLVPLCAILIVFALANRHGVSVRFDPVSPDNPLIPTLEMPLFAVIFGMLIIGVICGGAAAWFAQGRVRRERRRYKRAAERLERDMAALRRTRRAEGGHGGLDPEDLLEDHQD